MLVSKFVNHDLKKKKKCTVCRVLSQYNLLEKLLFKSFTSVVEDIGSLLGHKIFKFGSGYDKIHAVCLN